MNEEKSTNAEGSLLMQRVCINAEGVYSRGCILIYRGCILMHRVCIDA